MRVVSGLKLKLVNEQVVGLVAFILLYCNANVVNFYFISLNLNIMYLPLSSSLAVVSSAGVVALMLFNGWRVESCWFCNTPFTVAVCK